MSTGSTTSANIPELITLSKSDPDFQNYLLGTFSKSLRAIPIQSLNVLTDNETVTFKLIPESKIQKPNHLLKWIEVLKLHHCLLPALAMFLVITKALAQQYQWNANLAFISFIGVLFLMTAANLRNDYNDHVTGLDRMFEDAPERSIQKGWLTAHAAKRLSFIFFGGGFCCGFFALVQSPWVILLIGLLTLIALVGCSLRKFGLQYRIWTEIFTFFLLGPLLTVGFAVAIGIPIDLEVLLIGISTGWFSVFLLHLKNFGRLMVSNQIGLVNSLTWLGFERSKNLLQIWWFFLIGFFIVFQIYFGRLIWACGFFGLSIFLSGLFLRQLRSIRSPLGSELKVGLINIRKLGFILVSMWLLESLCYLLVLELGPA